MQAYERHLQQTQGLAPTTRAAYVPFVRSFLRHRFDSGPVTLSSVDADDVVRFVRHMAPGLRPKRAKVMAAALRSTKTFRLASCRRETTRIPKA